MPHLNAFCPPTMLVRKSIIGVHSDTDDEKREFGIVTPTPIHPQYIGCSKSFPGSSINEVLLVASFCSVSATYMS
jgi:hypothetical protein